MRAYIVKVHVQGDTFNTHTIATHDLLHRFLRGMLDTESLYTNDTNVTVIAGEVDHIEINNTLDIEYTIEANY